MVRVPREVLKAVEARANEELENAGLNVRVKVETRYGYYAVDMYRPDGISLDTLIILNSSREARDYLFS
ncbi:MAG: hypothetical protein QXT54_04440, partial [Thermoplasmatales archaeon]